MAFTPAPSASKSFGSEVTAAYFTRFGDQLPGARVPDDIRRATVHRRNGQFKLISIMAKSRHAADLENHSWGLGSANGPRWLLLLQRHAAGSAHAYWEAAVEARLSSVGDNQGKLPCSQHHTGSAEQPEGYSPFCRFYHFVPPLRQLGLGSQLTAGAEVPFRAPIQSVVSYWERLATTWDTCQQ